MRSLQSLSAITCRIHSGSLAESSTPVVAACASALQAFTHSWAPCRGVSTSPLAARFRPTPSVRPVEDGLEEDAAALPPVQPDLVQQFMGPAVMCSFERRRDRIREAMQAFQRFPGDTGSSEVQVATLTEKILHMAEHMKEHRKDFSSRHGLRGMLSQRRKLLQYLRRTDFDAYAGMLSKLGLKDTYAKQDRLAIRRTRGIDNQG